MLRIFKCGGCGYEYRFDLPSVVHRCPKCERPVIANGYSFDKLDYYSQMKYHWIRNPDYHTDHIKHRTPDNPNMPDILEIN